jgi:uncharacterized protein (TIGR02145 family)
VEGKNTPVLTTPVLMTSAIDSISNISAKSGGEIKSDGGLAITAKGICWSTKSSPTITDSKTTDGTSAGNFTSNLTGLKAGLIYFVRAYATNSKGTSYGNEISFKTLKLIGLGQNITDIDGNIYKTVYIGSQQWMAENLKVSKYNDGTVIPNITEDSKWSNLTSGAWSYYNNDAYGKLYNWYAVTKTTNGNKNVCPTGWHVPTDAEWMVLIDYLGGLTVAGGKMKEVGTTSWYSPNKDATNTSLFSALPGGYRGFDGNDGSIGAHGFWWSSSEFSPDMAYNRYLYYNIGGNVSSHGNSKKYGFSVRCLRD